MSFLYHLYSLNHHITFQTTADDSQFIIIMLEVFFLPICGTNKQTNKRTENKKIKKNENEKLFFPSVSLKSLIWHVNGFVAIY